MKDVLLKAIDIQNGFVTLNGEGINVNIPAQHVYEDYTFSFTKETETYLINYIGESNTVTFISKEEDLVLYLKLVAVDGMFNLDKLMIVPYEDTLK